MNRYGMFFIQSMMLMLASRLNHRALSTAKLPFGTTTTAAVLLRDCDVEDSEDSNEVLCSTTFVIVAKERFKFEKFPLARARTLLLRQVHF